MRFMPVFMDRLQSALSTGFIGDNKTNGRVTVEPLWQLNATPSIYGNSVRGPYRWFQDVDDSGVEWEVPNIKNISWDRQESQDLATCTITLYNMWHEGNLEQQELAGQLGKPGYFWPKRGLEVNRWNQLGGKGSLRKDGFWDPNFSWQNVLVQYALIRTYEGIGGNPTPENFTSVQDNLDDEHLVQTGTWLIDFVTAGSNGEMVLNCKDMGKLMLDQSCFPPIVPDGLYPLEYYPAGKSAFDSVFGAKPKTGVSPGSQGEVKSEYVASSADDFNEGFDVDIYGHKGSYAVDGNWLTSAWSEAHPLPAATVFWDFDILDPISKLSIKTWAGGYECYVSIMRDDEWLPGETIPGLSEPYLVKINIPFAIPDNNEPVINIELPDSFKNLGDTGYAQRVKISLRNLYYSGLADGFNFYRGGIRDLIFYREGAKVDPYTPDFATIPWTFSMCAHPTRGYWVIDDGGNVYGFGDAADYDSTAFGAVPLAERSGHSDNQSIAMCAHPDGKGYWVLDRMGHVFPYGSAEFYGEFEVPWPGSDKWGEDGLAAWDITPTHTGNGYWVCYGDGRIKGFGDATPSDVTLPWTSVGMFMNTFVNERYLYQHQANGITGHPTKMGFWVTTGSGEVYAFGDCAHYGQLDQRVYNPGMADTFRLSKTEYTKSIESTKSGNGYWIAFGSGHIAAYGDAVGQGPSYIYPQNNTGIEIPIDETNIIDWSFFRAIVWDMARDPDGTGFWVLVADGNVGSYSAEFWGSPGYQGLTGYRWHEGNFDGEYSSLIKELLGWAGFTLYNPSLGSNPPEIFGSIESTGIKTDTYISADKFDKRPIIDIVKELCEVVGYRFRIQEDGSIALGSPNIWRSGNFDIDGVRIYVDEDGNRVDADDPDAIEFIPMIDEEIDMFDYNTTLSSESMRSEIIIGNELPDPSNPSVTSFVRHTPRSGSELVAPGIPMLRGISRVGIWLSQLFTNQEEMRLMAELISLNAWFAERTASTTCVANPCLTGDTWVMTDEGPRQIIELVDKPFNAIVDGVSYPASGFWSTGVKPVMRVECKDGRRLDLTSNHELLVSRRINRNRSEYIWVQAKDLIPGDKLVIQKHEYLEWDGYGDFGDGYCLGLWKGDGSTERNDRPFLEIFDKDIGSDACGDYALKHLNKRSAKISAQRGNITSSSQHRGVSFHQRTQKWMAQVQHNKEATFLGYFDDELDAAQAVIDWRIQNNLELPEKTWNHSDTKEKSTLYHQALAEIMRESDMGGDKYISNKLEKSSSEFIAGFLSGWFDADGGVSNVKKEKGIAVSLTCMHREELVAAQRMLQRLGINSRIYKGPKNQEAKLIGNNIAQGKQAWKLVISKDNLEKFSSRIGFHNPRKQKSLNNLLSSLTRGLYRDRYESEIESIIPHSTEEVYDVSVQEKHCFDANGLTAHNCLSLGDQVKLAERNTSEYNIHYITGISSNHDLDTGVWQYTLTTHWLGDADNWVITADASTAPVDGYHYIEISERVDRWQQERGFGLQKGAQANGAPESDNIIGFTGDFNKAATPVYVGTAPVPEVTTLYSMPDWEDGFSDDFPPPPQGGMTYVNEFYDLEDIYSLTHEIQIFNQTELDSNIYMQLYDGDCGDAGQYYGLQTLNNMIWSQFGTNDLYNVEPEAFTSTVSDSELGAPFIGLRRTFDALEPLKPGLYYVRVERDEYDATSWADASYAYGGDWFSMYLTAPGHPEFLMGRMRFPREAAGVPASYHDNGGTWMEAWNNNNDDTLYPVDYLHLATKSRANGQPAVSAVSHYSLMPNVDIWAEEPKAGWVHHLIGEGVVKGHDEGTLWDASTTVEQQNQVNKITWTLSGTRDAYRVYRGSNLNDLNMIQEIPGDDLKIYFNTAWQPTNAVVPGQTYLYGVSAVNDGGESAIGLVGDTGIDTNDLWVFNGELVLKKAFNNLYFTIESRTAPLGDTSFLEIYNGTNLVLNQEIKDINSSILLPTLGVDNATTTYSFTVKGYPSATGNGYLKLNITENRNIDLSIVDTLLVTR